MLLVWEEQMQWMLWPDSRSSYNVQKYEFDNVQIYMNSKENSSIANVFLCFCGIGYTKRIDKFRFKRVLVMNSFPESAKTLKRSEVLNDILHVVAIFVQNVTFEKVMIF